MICFACFLQTLTCFHTEMALFSPSRRPQFLRQSEELLVRSTICRPQHNSMISLNLRKIAYYWIGNLITSHLKNTSNAQLRCCEPLQNAHILPCMLRFFIGLRLVLLRNLHFWDGLKYPLKNQPSNIPPFHYFYPVKLFSISLGPWKSQKLKCHKKTYFFNKLYNFRDVQWLL